MMIIDESELEKEKGLQVSSSEDSLQPFIPYYI